jgi:antitoxin component YwqK of YwqJK toxin-antitoxin module
MAKPPRKRETHHHKDGSVRAKGWLRDGQLDGHWEWFRKDGTKMRSGDFDMGRQVGEWTTYDAKGEVYKVTRMKG